MQTKLMAKLGLTMVCAFVAMAVLASYPTPRTLPLIVTTNTVPQVLGSNNIRFHNVCFRGCKGAGNNRTNNTSPVWIQWTSTNDAGGTKLLPGQFLFLTSIRGFDAGDFWIDVETSGDGIVAEVWDPF